MDITLDVGSEISSLLQKLADQIGVTVAQIFPWYVQQAWLEGVLFVALLLSFWAIFIPLFSVAAKRADFNNGNVYSNRQKFDQPRTSFHDLFPKQYLTSIHLQHLQKHHLVKHFKLLHEQLIVIYRTS